MDMIDIHKKAMKSSVVSYHKFTLSYDYNPRARKVYGFVEGKDDIIFYRHLIRKHLPDDWDVNLIAAQGKKQVIEVFHMINWSKHSKKHICFFIDRDLSELLGDNLSYDDNFYITENYSIENYFVTFEMLQCVLEEIHNINLDAPETIKLESLFKNNLHMFQEAVTPVMAQILIWKRNLNSSVDLDRIKVEHFFNFEEGQLNLKKEFSSSISRVEHAAKCTGTFSVNYKDIIIVESEFREKQGVEKFIRGKYMLSFFLMCAKAIYSSINIYCKEHSTPPKQQFYLGNSNFILILAPRIRCPLSLKQFIQENYCKYIDEIEPLLCV